MKKTAFSKMLAVLLSAMMVLGTLAAIPAAAVATPDCPGSAQTHSLENCKATKIGEGGSVPCKDSYTEYKCDTCGREFYAFEEAAEDHKWVETNEKAEKPATCTTVGEKYTHKCSVCGEYKVEYTFWLGHPLNGSWGLDETLGTLDDIQGTHDWSDEFTFVDGEKVWACKREGCTATKGDPAVCDRNLPNGTHVWTAMGDKPAIAPTFEGDVAHYYCEDCGATEEVTAHNHDLEFVAYNPATCETPGNYSHWKCEAANCPNKYFMTFDKDEQNHQHEWAWDGCLVDKSQAIDPYETMEVFGANILAPVEDALASITIPAIGHYFPYKDGGSDLVLPNGLKAGTQKVPREPLYTETKNRSELVDGSNKYYIADASNCTVEFYCENCDTKVKEQHHLVIQDKYIPTTCETAGEWKWECDSIDCDDDDTVVEFKENATGHIVYKDTAFEVGINKGKDAWKLFEANRYYFENLTVNPWVYSNDPTKKDYDPYKKSELTWYCEKGEGQCTAEGNKHVTTIIEAQTKPCAHETKKVECKKENNEFYIIETCTGTCKQVLSKEIAADEIDLTLGDTDATNDIKWEDYIKPDAGHPHDFTDVQPETAANTKNEADACAEKTYLTYKCKDCGLLVKVVTKIQPHKPAKCIDNCEHQSCVSVGGKAPTCKTDGYKPVHLCSACDKWYVITTDDSGILAPEVKDYKDHAADDMKIPALKHTFEREGAEGEASGIFPAVESTCDAAGSKAYAICTDANCDYLADHGFKYMVDENGVEVTDPATRNDLVNGNNVPKLHDPANLVFVPGVAATCSSTGMVAHYHCDTCLKNFAVGEDGAVGNEITTTVETINNVRNLGIWLDKIEHYFNTDFLNKVVENTECNEVVLKDSDSKHNYTMIQYTCGCGDMYIFDHDYHVHDDAAINKDRELLNRKDLPGCETVGYDYFYSTKCDAIIKVEVPATGHFNGDNYFTSGCNDKEENRVCINKDCDAHGPATEEGKEVGKTFHKWEAITDQEPSCTADGLHGKICAFCGDAKDLKVLPKLGHELYIKSEGERFDFVKPTETAKGVAVLCCDRDGCDFVKVDNEFTGLKYGIRVENATVADAGFTDGSIVKVTVSVKGLPEASVRSLAFGVNHNSFMEFLGAEFVSTKFTATTRAESVDADEVYVFAVAPNNTDATEQDVVITAEEDVVVLNFRIRAYNTPAGEDTWYADSFEFSVSSGCSYDYMNDRIVFDEDYHAISTNGDLPVYVEGADEYEKLQTNFETFLGQENDWDANAFATQFETWRDVLEAAKANATAIAEGEILPFLEVNGDRVINIDDVTDMCDMITEGTYNVAFDLNRDGAVTVDDVTLIADYIMEIKSYVEVAGYPMVEEEPILPTVIILTDGTVLVFVDGEYVPVGTLSTNK